MSSQLISLQFNVDGQDQAVINRLRSDLLYWNEVAVVADTSGNAGFTVTSVIPTSTTLPALIFQNNGIVPVSLAYKGTHGGTTQVVIVPAGDFSYLPQVDYSFTFSAQTTSSTAPCIAWVGYS